MHPGLFGGISGLGWTIDHISKIWNCDDTQPASDDISHEIDGKLLKGVGTKEWRGPYDLIHGLVGMGVYFIERLPRSAAEKALVQIVDHLERLCEVDGRSCTWRTRSEQLMGWQRVHHANGYYNLGVAHGVPGVIQFLDNLAALGIEYRRCRQLAEGATRWLLEHARKRADGTWFGTWITPLGEMPPARFAWCYGDLGIVGTLSQFADRGENPAFEECLDDILDQCLKRDAGQVNIEDSPFCHGAIGAAHIFNRIYQRTGDSRCRERALHWIEIALRMRQPGNGIGGVLAVQPNLSVGGESLHVANPSLLDGAIGVALVLLAAVSPTEPEWDRMFLMSSKTLSNHPKQN